MIRVITVLATALSASTFADYNHCDPAGVAQYGRRLERASQRFEQIVGGTPGCQHLAGEAYTLSREAGRVALSAQAGSSCLHLQSDYQFVSRSYQALAAAQSQAHGVSPNPTVMDQWSKLDRVHRSLYYAVTQGPVAPPPPPPPPALVTVNVDCGSSQYHYRECPVNGRIVAGRLLQQHSSAGCQQGRSYGFLFGAVWVDRGCRGLFSVTVQP